MTPAERAEKIIQWHVFRFFQKQGTKIGQYEELPNITDGQTLKDVIAAEIESAVDEALLGQKCKTCGCTYEGCTCNPVREMDARAEGYRLGLEEAAKVAELHITNRLGGIYGEGYDAATVEIARNIRVRTLK